MPQTPESSKSSRPNKRLRDKENTPKRMSRKRRVSNRLKSDSNTPNIPGATGNITVSYDMTRKTTHVNVSSLTDPTHTTLYTLTAMSQKSRHDIYLKYYQRDPIKKGSRKDRTDLTFRILNIEHFVQKYAAPPFSAKQFKEDSDLRKNVTLLVKQFIFEKTQEKYEGKNKTFLDTKGLKAFFMSETSKESFRHYIIDKFNRLNKPEETENSGSGSASAASASESLAPTGQRKRYIATISHQARAAQRPEATNPKGALVFAGLKLLADVSATQHPVKL